MAQIGRPTKYKKVYCSRILKFFDIEPIKVTTEKFYYKNGDEKEKEVEVGAELPLISEFERRNMLGVGRCSKWAKATNEDGSYKYPEFRQAYKMAKRMQEEILVKNALKGLYAGPFSIFAAKNMFGWRDKQEHEHSTPEGRRFNVNITTVPDGDKLDPNQKTE